MEKKSVLFTIFALLAMSTEAGASTVWVRGRLEDTSYIYNGSNPGPTVLAYEGQFEITYQNQDLPWGTQVFVAWGERCNGVSRPWSEWKAEMRPVSAYTWQVQIDGPALFEQLARNGRKTECSHLEFAFVYSTYRAGEGWDNGGRGPKGFYSVQMPGTNTLTLRYPASTWPSLPVYAMGSGYDY